MNIATDTFLLQISKAFQMLKKDIFLQYKTLYQLMQGFVWISYAFSIDKCQTLVAIISTYSRLHPDQKKVGSIWVISAIRCQLMENNPDLNLSILDLVQVGGIATKVLGSGYTNKDKLKFWTSSIEKKTH